MTNQASEDIDTGVLLRTQIRKTLHDNEIGFSMVNAGDRTPKQMVEELVEQLAKHYEALIRTEKLKLLSEVRERVQVNQKGQFEQDGTGTVCWYLDDLVEALKELEAEL